MSESKKLNKLSDPALIDLLHEGGVGVIPTDTVYGLVCRASDQTSVERLYALKMRNQKPGTVIAADIQQIIDLGIPARYVKAVAQFWPNPITIIIPTTPSLSYLDLGKMSLAVRIPKDPELINLLKTTGPLLTTSANHPGQPTANDIQEARRYFRDQVDFYVDGGDLSGRKASTLIRMVDDAIEVLREGDMKVTEKGEISYS